MTNTQGLDALAALCGSATAAAPTAEGSAAATATAPHDSATAVPPPNAATTLATGAGGAPPPSAATTAASTLYVQQQQQQMQAAHQQQVQALQLQHAQQVLAMRQAQAQAAAAQQQQQQHSTAAATAPGTGALPPHLVQLQQAQLQSMLQQANQLGYNQVQTQALVAQLLGAQHQHQRANPGAVNHQGLAAGLPPVALAGLGAAPGALSQLASSSPALPMSPALQQTAASNMQAQLSSTPTLAMPPPPTNVVPSLPVSNPGKSTASGNSIGSSQSLLAAASNSGRGTSGAGAATAAVVQPPIQDIISEWEGKKVAKRAANRLSAHLSRKRKKMFIEDLKDENLELRRKEQILRSIPDLIVVFDSSGCISFVSHSVTRFLDHSSEELVNTSFWELLTEESVRMIKSAFMDALAVKRPPEEDSTPLGNGDSIKVTLVCRGDSNEGQQNQQRQDDDGLHVSLKGVVHFAGESPECVCSIRPESSRSSGGKTHKKGKTASLSQNRQERAVPVGVPPSHQISDIDSEQS